MRQWCRLRFGPAVIAVLAALAGAVAVAGREPPQAGGGAPSLDLRSDVPRQMIRVVNTGGQVLRVIEP